jgi:YD repeat-containing protein
MILRGNLRELFKKLRQLLKPRLLLKPMLVPVVFLFVFFLVVGFFAITQETGDADNPNHGDPGDDSFSMEEGEAGIEPEFLPMGPPRWFRSNAGGMTLEEIPSRLGALRNKYALVIDYVTPDELDPRLTPFYEKEYIIEIRILYIEKKESRKQWLFRDKSGNTRLNAVFRPPRDEDEPSSEESEEPESEESVLAMADNETDIETDIETEDGQPAASEETASSEEDSAFEEAAASMEDGNQLALADMEEEDALPDGVDSEAGAAGGNDKEDPKVPSGFIEVYDEASRLVRDYSLFEDGGEILTEYFYKDGTLIRAETKRKEFEEWEYRKMYTDNYRYNRSYSLRNVERVFHEALNVEPVRIVFPGRVLDAANDKNFLKENLTLASDFFGGYQADAGFRITYDTDSKGRVLNETMFNGKNEVVWTLKNTWVGDRITSILKTEGEDERLIEYDYDGSGNRIAERDIRNGILERQMLINGDKETEELYLDGVMVLRAFWENGRKISEERVRRR